MRVLVCGGRSYDDRKHVYAVLDAVRESLEKGDELEICEGDAGEIDNRLRLIGADRLAGLYATEYHLVHHTYPANWKRDGKAAGPIRNSRMLKEFKPQLVIAFEGGKGTDHMCEIAEKAGIEVLQV